MEKRSDAGDDGSAFAALSAQRTGPGLQNAEKQPGEMESFWIRIMIIIVADMRG